MLVDICMYVWSLFSTDAIVVLYSRRDNIRNKDRLVPLGNPRFPEASADVNSKHDWLRNDWLNE